MQTYIFTRASSAVGTTCRCQRITRTTSVRTESAVKRRRSTCIADVAQVDSMIENITNARSFKFVCWEKFTSFKLHKIHIVRIFEFYSSALYTKCSSTVFIRVFNVKRQMSTSICNAPLQIDQWRISYGICCQSQ